MFKSKSNAAVNELQSSSTTIIGAGTTIYGNIESNGDIRIDGKLIGNLEAKSKVIIGANGEVEGDIYGKQADILGKVLGKIKIEELLFLHGKAVVNGDLFAGKLQIEPTASFNGQCHMGANIVELKIERNLAVNE